MVLEVLLHSSYKLRKRQVSWKKGTCSRDSEPKRNLMTLCLCFQIEGTLTWYKFTMFLQISVNIFCKISDNCFLLVSYIQVHMHVKHLYYIIYHMLIWRNNVTTKLYLCMDAVIKVKFLINPWLCNQMKMLNFLVIMSTKTIGRKTESIIIIL